MPLLNLRVEGQISDTKFLSKLKLYMKAQKTKHYFIIRTKSSCPLLRNHKLPQTLSAVLLCCAPCIKDLYVIFYERSRKWSWVCRKVSHYLKKPSLNICPYSPESSIKAQGFFNLSCMHSFYKNESNTYFSYCVWLAY